MCFPQAPDPIEVIWPTRHQAQEVRTLPPHTLATPLSPHTHHSHRYAMIQHRVVSQLVTSYSHPLTNHRSTLGIVW